MAEERLFGNSIEESVVNEIKKREKLLSRVDTEGSNLLPDTDPNLNSLRYFLQKGAWIRIVSSVNTNPRDSDTGTGNPFQFEPFVDSGSSFTAKNFILTGGEITSTGRKAEGISFDSFDTTKSYRKTETLGVRPEAGITSFSIKHKGTYGSLREADISFNVWSKEDLNRAQDIYMRPGVHMIVEWGHTLDSDITPVKLPDVDRYFEETTRIEIQKIINNHRENNLSYEGFIGLITNFSWSFREDGGYDCTIKIISAGAVMESLTTIQGASHLTTAESKGCKGVNNEDEIDDSKKSTIHDFIYGVKKDAKIFKDGATQGGPEFDTLIFFNVSKKPGPFTANIGTTTQRFSQAVQKILKDNNISLYGFSTTLSEDAVTNLPLSGDHFRYISIRDLLKFLNASEFFPRHPNGEKDSNFFIEEIDAPFLVSQKELEQDTTIKPGRKGSTYPKYKTFPEHFSLDIKACFLPLSPVTDNEAETPFIEKISLSPELQVAFAKAIFDNQSDNIQSILVELDFLLEVFDAALSSEEDNIYKLDVFSFMKNLLKGINNALGNITDLDLHFKEDLQQYIIVDREAPTAIENIAELSFTGLSNTVQKVSIETKITSQLSSQIAISAQGTKSIKQGDNNSNLAMIQWNAGIQDRFNKKDNGPADPQPPLPPCAGGSEESSGSELDRLKKQEGKISRDLSSGKETKPSGTGDRLVTTDITETRRIQLAAELKEVRAKIATIEVKNQLNLDNPFIESFLKPWSETFEALIKDQRQRWYSLFSTTIYKASLFSKTRRFGISYFRDKYFTFIGGEDKKDKTSDPGLIPIELSLTLDGIGGLKIGQVFKLSQVEKFLPDAYKDYGFIITAIDNAIENNKWNTTLRALTFKIPTTVSKGPAKSSGLGSAQSLTKVGTQIEQDDKFREAKTITEQYLGKQLTNSEFDKFLRAVAGETSPGASNFQENAAISSVILNRVLSTKFPNDLDSVLTQRNQFQAVTGTFKNNRQPSAGFLSPTPKTISNVEDSIISSLLGFKSQNWLNFTAANRKAYKEGTSVQFLDQALLTPGNKTIGGTVFFTVQSLRI